MSRASNSLLFKCFYHFLWILFFAKALSVVVSFLLPYGKVQHYELSQSNFGHADITLRKTFAMNVKKKEIKPITVKKPTLLIKDMILKGIYLDKQSAYAIIAFKRKRNDIKIVSKGENFNGYKIVKIYPKKVFLQKNGKIYLLSLEKIDKNNSNANNNFVPESTPVVLRSSDVYKYVNHFDKIWKEIRIDDVRKNGKLKGFIVRWIKPGSIFTKIGLKKGDTIIKVNDTLLKSYKDAFDYYEKLKKKEINVLRLTVIRNNKEKEIEYELF